MSIQHLTERLEHLKLQVANNEEEVMGFIQDCEHSIKSTNFILMLMAKTKLEDYSFSEYANRVEYEIQLVQDIRKVCSVIECVEKER
jgi:predicted RND superfamily exporter protein